MKLFAKHSLLLVLVFAGLQSGAQSLKELLYSGKLKTDANTVVRKSDDLSTKIDTAARKPESVAAATPATAPTLKVDASGTVTAAAAPPVTNAAAATEATGADSAAAGAENVDANTTAAAAKPAVNKSNTVLWKEYTDSLVSSLKGDVMNNKRIKKETYYVTVDYEIGLDGKVAVTNVLTTPQNNLLQALVKDRMELMPLQLAPQLGSDGQPRKAKRKQNFVIPQD